MRRQLLRPLGNAFHRQHTWKFTSVLNMPVGTSSSSYHSRSAVVAAASHHESRMLSTRGQRRTVRQGPAFRRLYSTENRIGYIPESTEEVASQLEMSQLEKLSRIRNIGISAHIDSGKTTLSERILFYTGRIQKVHEVKGTDGVGAKMDSMDLEREKGITIQSAATYCQFGEHGINVIDTPGHVDFTIEVERALRVLDGAILILCGVAGVQSQSMTVDRQMKRYSVPRLCFINKCDRMGANPDRAVTQVQEKLGLNAAFVQVPIGLEDQLSGVIDIIERQAVYFEGEDGTQMVRKEIPERFKEEVEAKRKLLMENLAEVDPEIEELYLMEEEPTTEQIHCAIRRQVLTNKFVPVFVGSAKKNTGVQTLLEGVVKYLPNPAQINNFGMDRSNNEEQVLMIPNDKKDFVGLAFKLEEGKYGQLTYMRIYQGTLKKGDFIYNTTNQQKIKVPRLVKMHSDEMEDVSSVGPGEICALFGVDCSSGDTFTSSLKTSNYGMETMFVPEPVISLSARPADKTKDSQFSKAVTRFMKEDPTFKVHFDTEAAQTIVSGMGELHLEIYMERMRREYDCPVITGKPYVAYRETMSKRTEFDYLHRKQSGGAGQYARVIGYIEPMDPMGPEKFAFENQVIGNTITPNFIAACEKGFRESVLKGPLLECPVWGVRVVLTDGATHVVDSSELAFRIACQNAFREAFAKAMPSILEPIMRVDIQTPSEFQGSVLGSISKRRGAIAGTEASYGYFNLTADVPLGEMFGYATELRSLTQGKGEFSMEYVRHEACTRDVFDRVIAEYERNKKEKQ